MGDLHIRQNVNHIGRTVHREMPGHGDDHPTVRRRNDETPLSVGAKKPIWWTNVPRGTSDPPHVSLRCLRNAVRGISSGGL